MRSVHVLRCKVGYGHKCAAYVPTVGGCHFHRCHAELMAGSLLRGVLVSFFRDTTPDLTLITREPVLVAFLWCLVTII